MSISRWKLMACSLGLSVGGLTVVAGQINNRLNAQWDVSTKPSPEATQSAPVEPLIKNKPSAAPAGSETRPSAAQAIELELVAPQPLPVGPAAAPMTVSAPNERPTGVNEAVEDLPEPVPATPKAGAVSDRNARQASAPEILLPQTPTVTSAPSAYFESANPVAPVPGSIAPPAIPSAPLTQAAPMAPMAPEAQRGVQYPSAQPQYPAAQPQANPSAAPVAVLTPLPPQTSSSQIQQTASAAASGRLKMLLRLGDGKPRFEIRTSDSTELLLKVYGEKVEMQAAPESMKAHPIAGVTAVGQVRFVGPGVEGTCDQLSVLSGTGEVLLKGNVSLKTKRGKTWSEMTADKMIYQIGTGASAATANSGQIRPASYSTRD